MDMAPRGGYVENLTDRWTNEHDSLRQMDIWTNKWTVEQIGGLRGGGKTATRFWIYPLLKKKCSKNVQFYVIL